MRAGITFFIILGAIGIHSVAQAGGNIIGSGAVKANEDDYPQFCEITIFNRDTEFENHCSGTLVGAQEIATAGHCFGRYFDAYRSDVSVSCGGEYASVDDIVLPKDHQWYTSTMPFPSVDYARITLRKPLTGSIPKATGTSLYFTGGGALLPGVKCFMAGFGNSRSSRFGTLYIANVSSFSLIYGEGVITMRDPAGGYLSISGDHGDSGGALYCQAPGKRVELVGVIVGYVPEAGRDRNRLKNLFAPIWNQRI